ncbi:protein kinase domain-containing protein [Streptomyces sp. KLOTTS4A1]|uniref:protein kinase domain-containing protein n=1 Tax=Streptomyces sp. KLOTTS4A1 TaxID=3390996 RepID=UPI0039F61ACE
MSGPPRAEESLAVDVPAGFRVGPWKVREPVGSGAFATVYAAELVRAEADGSVRAEPDGSVRGEAEDSVQAEAEDSVRVHKAPESGLPGEVALKFLPTGTRTPRQLRHLRELAEREVELLSRLRAPRLIRMYETRTAEAPEDPELDGATVLVLEKAGQSVEDLLADGPAPGAPALLAQVAEGIHQLHEAGWVHGDLKPANVLVMADGSVRLADFNMAAELEGTHAYTPAFATPDYTPPELLWPEMDERGARIRPSADIWAFGVLAHLVLTGTYPLPGATTEARVDAATRYARGTDTLRLSPELTDAWREIITDCLAPTHTGRSALDSATLLRRVEAVTGTGRPPRLFRPPRLLRSPHPSHTQLSRARRPRTRRIRRPALLATVTAVVALLAASAFTYLGLRPQSGDGLSYGYARCPLGSVCFFSEQNGMGDMCAWEQDDRDWLSGKEHCLWTREKPVRSIFYNSGESSGRAGVAYYRGRDFTPVGEDITRPDSRMRTGCTAQRAQGNLAGTYAPRSHRFIEHCGVGADSADSADS